MRREPRNVTQEPERDSVPSLADILTATAVLHPRTVCLLGTRVVTGPLTKDVCRFGILNAATRVWAGAVGRTGVQTTTSTSLPASTQAAVSRLASLGIPSEQAHRALALHGNDFNAAVLWLAGQVGLSSAHLAQVGEGGSPRSLEALQPPNAAVVATLLTHPVLRAGFADARLRGLLTQLSTHPTTPVTDARLAEILATMTRIVYPEG